MSVRPDGVDAAAGDERLIAALLDVVGVMDQLRSPGGCPWDAEQTHASLAPYVVEEAHEVAEAAEAGDLVALREELGDVLLQVLFHARVAQEAPDGVAFDLADVASGLAAKLRRRHPHVFADPQSRPLVRDVAAVNAQWEQIKEAEKAGGGGGGGAGVSARNGASAASVGDGGVGVAGGSAGVGVAGGSAGASVGVSAGTGASAAGDEVAAAASSILDGVPASLPALARAQKVLRRARRAGIAVGPVFADVPDLDDASGLAAEELGAELLAIAARADAAGVDAEAALRAQVRGVVAQVRAAEASTD